MARRVRVSAVSSDFIILDPAAGDERGVETVLASMRRLIAPVLPERPDLIVLPEVCDRPDNYEMPRRRAYYDCRAERVLDFFRQTARQNRCWVVYPTERLDEGGAWRNAAYLIDRAGHVRGVYDKMFVTISQMEEDGFPCAREPAFFETDFGTLGMAICFDLNFPALLEAYARMRPDLIVFPSHFHGAFLGEHWAWACQAFFLGAIARHECYLISPAGQAIARSSPGRRFLTAEINLDRCVVHCDWKDLPRLDALKAARGKDVEITDAGFGGNFIVSAGDTARDAAGMAREAGLMPLDDYLLKGEGRTSAWPGA